MIVGTDTFSMDIRERRFRPHSLKTSRWDRGARTDLLGIVEVGDRLENARRFENWRLAEHDDRAAFWKENDHREITKRYGEDAGRRRIDRRGSRGSPCDGQAGRHDPGV